ncbi:alpha-galactosidase [Frigoribacterium sp. MEB024]|uniref:alpha-galactosidase n=1 Tax=Frigoribacterium sp. MEB024 TaxID=1589899 RepID=UPI0005B7D0FB|nr:alpha-galactosidase [Frigoribacterium sp. MEB024]
MSHPTPSPTVVAPSRAPDAFVHLSSAGVSLLLDVTEARLPAVLHWGAALGRPTLDDVLSLAAAAVPPYVNNLMDEPVRLAILPEHHAGWSGKPGVGGHRSDGADWSPRFTVDTLDVTGEAEATRASSGPELVDAGAAVVTVEAHDDVAGLAVVLEIELTASGLVRTRAELTNVAGRRGGGLRGGGGATGDDRTTSTAAGAASTAADVYTLTDLHLALPVPPRAREILDFAGRWGKERTPQRRELVVGVHEREGRKGRTGPDAATVLSVGVPGFGFGAGSGEVWGLHVGFSGNHRHYAERLSTGAQVLGGGELLLPGELRLEVGESYRSPWIFGSYGDGLDDQARRFHRWLRSREQHPTRPRPMTINVWEAVYFDHDLARLRDLADRAATLGVERYVLDDGWFRGRRDDHAGLGDWVVDADVWPDGLSPLIDHVTGLGMEFGLWFEPEMVNEDSDLAREHPEWLLQTGDRLPPRSRDQQVLNLGIAGAFEHVLGQMTAILTEYDIAYLKWDHNRDLVDAGTWPTGAAGVHEQTLAAYRLMDELKARFPGLEIESCSSGGARVDLGVLERTDRVWVSDCIDPLDRQQMNRWTMQLLPPELLGSHIASGVSHSTGRWHELSFRAGTALFGHLGIEWDLARATDAENRDLAAWIALYKEHRQLMHTGDLVRVDEADPSLLVYGSVAADASEALFFLASVGRSDVAPLGRVLLPGLDPERRYRVAPVTVGSPDHGLTPPPWWGTADEGGAYPGVELDGRALAVAGVQAPSSFPERVVLLRVTAER